MRPALACCAAFLAGCAFDAAGIPSGDTFDADPNAPDADPNAPDADPTAPDAGCLPSELTFTPLNVDACDLPVSMGDFEFSSAVKHQIDTQANTIRSGGVVITSLAHAVITQAGSSQEAMVILADDLGVESGAEISVIGSRPLIVIALKTLRIDGSIDASGSEDTAGPGSDLLCTTGAGAPGVTQSGNQAVSIPGGSGGGGAGYGTGGGTGARVSPQGTPDAPTVAGVSWGMVPSPLVGGCSGGAGGISMVPNIAAWGGGGGGGLELVAGTEVRVDGVVTVSGGGGGGAGAGTTLEYGGGGGGGGSGGTLLLQSPMVKIMSGKLTSNGGAGGEGRSDGFPGTGGQDGSASDDTVAVGGMGVAGGNGGVGGTRNVDASPGTVGTGSTTATAGGGGGGGAVGRITYRASVVSVMGSDVVSPNAVTLPL